MRSAQYAQQHRCSWAFYNAACSFGEAERKSKKSGMWTNASATVGKDLQELTSFLGSNSLNCQSERHKPVPDPLLSPSLCSTTFSDLKTTNKMYLIITLTQVLIQRGSSDTSDTVPTTWRRSDDQSSEK
ncbi:hypothetical protein ACH5RR_025431 [Cinchona calisaya]|uniref:Uncharacterized protein n=1 Tax=Cinchona calisaya TaxID=153742 RepID=A0ABD2YZL6_9GENT